MNDKREQKDDSEQTSIKELEDILKQLLNDKNSKHYFGIGENGGKYKDPPTRYEAWFMASSLSNIILIDRIDKLINVLGKKGK